MVYSQFDSMWIFWIKSILRKKNYLVLVNGSSSPEFKSGRDLRQGNCYPNSVISEFVEDGKNTISNFF